VSSRGFIKLPVLISVVLGVGFVASVFLNIVQNQRAQQDHKLLQGEITDLRYQVNEDKVTLDGGSPKPSPSTSSSPSASASPSPSASPDASPTPTPTGSVAGASTPKTVKAASVQPNLRAKPNSSGTPLMNHVPAGTTATLVDDTVTNGYQHVTINGQTGYILASYLQ